MKKHPSWARNNGYIVDHYTYPWIAYKGPRFSPTEIFEVYTDKEEELMLENEQLKQQEVVK